MSSKNCNRQCMLKQMLENKLARWDESTLTRKRMSIRKTEGNQIEVDNEHCINFSHNDYLGLAKHPDIMQATIKGLQYYGLGSGASSVVSGYYSAQEELEAAFSEWLKMENAIVFSSGYLANLGVVSALIDRSHTVFSDKMSHASLLDGIQLSRAKHYRYQHHSITDLKRLAEFKTPDYIITESVFSMGGAIASVSDIIQIADHYDASVIVDDAHGIGVLGKNGRGICEYAGIDPHHLACMILPLGKAFNGMGAIVAGKKTVTESILQFARSYRYSTAIPPAICVGLLTALNVIQSEVWRREKLAELIDFFIMYALSRGLRISSSDPTPIKSIIVGDNDKVLYLQKKLHQEGFLISSIRPPTVPKNSARIRVSLNCNHTKDQVVQLLDAITNGLAEYEK